MATGYRRCLSGRIVLFGYSGLYLEGIMLHPQGTLPRVCQDIRSPADSKLTHYRIFGGVASLRCQRTAFWPVQHVTGTRVSSFHLTSTTLLPSQYDALYS
jgi:hypothetical protein